MSERVKAVVVDKGGTAPVVQDIELVDDAAWRTVVAVLAEPPSRAPHNRAGRTIP